MSKNGIIGIVILLLLTSSWVAIWVGVIEKNGLVINAMIGVVICHYCFLMAREINELKK